MSVEGGEKKDAEEIELVSIVSKPQAFSVLILSTLSDIISEC